MAKPSIAIGTKVRFLSDKLGASRRDELWCCVAETVGPSYEGVVSFAHPNPALAKQWVYVEVDSRTEPGEKLYVGVTPRMVEVQP